MGVGKKSAAQPAPPDPVATANAQAAQNAETARVNAALNREDQVTPYGSLTYSLIGQKPQGGAPATGGATTNQGMGTGTRTPSTQGIWRQEAPGYYRNMDTGKVEQYAQPPGTDGGDGTYYGAPTTAPAPANPAAGAPAAPGAQEQRWQSTMTLAPEQQRMLDLQNQAGIRYGETANRQLNAVSERLATPLSLSGMGPAPTMDPEMRERTKQSIISRSMPQMETQRAGLETRLRNQGLMPGTEAWKAEMDDWNRGMADMMLGADAAAGSEMARDWGMQTNARDRMINEMLMERQIPMQELTAMMTGAQVTPPSFIPTPQTQMQPVDIAGLTYGDYNARMAAANQQRQASSANMQGLAGLAGTAAMAYATNPWAWSDRRLKKNIVRIGSVGPIGLYRFTYVWGGAPQIGVMADEVAQWKPYAVAKFGVYAKVNYAEVL